MKKKKNKSQKIGFGGAFVKKNHDIKDMFDNSKLSLLLLRQTDLDKISAICQPVADASEFQIHYRALVLRMKNDTHEFILTIPTAFYNFKQEVATSSVEYHLNDIDAVAKLVQDISLQNCNKLLSLPIFSAMKALGFDIQTYESNCGSIHRHPGRFGFSSIDLNKDPSSPGVVYRNKVATDYVQSDSIIYLSANNETELYLTETKIVDIQTDNAFTKGTYTEIPTLTAVLGNSSSENSFDNLLGAMLLDIDTSYMFVGNARYTKHMLIQELLQAYSAFEFDADISHVVAKNITQSTFRTKAFSHTNNYHDLLSNTSDTQTSKKKKSNYYERVWGWYDEHLMANVDDPFYYNEHDGMLVDYEKI